MEQIEKYPDQFFHHWLAMFELHQQFWSKEAIKDQIGMYLQMEGEVEFESLQNELRRIVFNKDVVLFLKDIDSQERVVVTRRIEELELMIRLILDFHLE